MQQTYENHRHRPTLWLLTYALAIVGVAVMAVFVFRQPSVLTIGLTIVALSGLLTVHMLRQYALRLQNRIIRLEMQVRLARLGREADLARLSMRQVVALRFASDAELPPLIERALTENLTGEQIKRAVRDWQGDYLRT